MDQVHPKDVNLDDLRSGIQRMSEDLGYSIEWEGDGSVFVFDPLRGKAIKPFVPLWMAYQVLASMRDPSYPHQAPTLRSAPEA